MKKLLASLLLLPLGVTFVRAEEKPLEKPKTQTVKFELVPSGHFIVSVKLNGNGPYNLIFDTGAPTTLITPKIAKDAKVAGEAKDKPLIPLFGMMGQVKVKEFTVGDVKAKDVPAMIMDHPTVKAFSQEYQEKYGSIDGIVGFPFFAQFKMTVDYAAKEMTFTPNGYKPSDIMQDLMQTMMSSMGSKPQPKVAAPAGLWGVELAKSKDDENEGVDVKAVFAGTAAESGGIKVGDRVLTIDGRWTDSVSDAYTATSYIKPGKPVAVVVKRNGKEVKLTVTPKLGL